MVFGRWQLIGLAAGMVFGLAGFPAAASQLQASLDPAYPKEALLGPGEAKGAVIWSHGRSNAVEDSLSPTPYYMAPLRTAGWDTFRFDRKRDGDTLEASAKALVREVLQLRAEGYRKVVLTGQSFGAFLSLMAADESPEVHAVIATAPAAYGSFEDYHDSWQRNATRLYPLLDNIKSARVMLFYFHGDDFDPGGRGEPSERILNARKLDHLVIDQPADLTSHWAASSGLFVRRFGDCIRGFIEAPSGAAIACDESWGRRPEPGFTVPAAFQPAETTEDPDDLFQGSWYGYYPNGREVLLQVEPARGRTVTALYAVGPGLQSTRKTEYMRRSGHVSGDELVFNEAGKATLRYRLRGLGRIDATWISADGKITLEARLKRTGWPANRRIQTAAGNTAQSR